MRVCILIVVAIACMLTAAGCGNGVAGDTYTDTEGAISLTFHNDGTCLLRHSVLGDCRLKYKQDGKTVEIYSDADVLGSQSIGDALEAFLVKTLGGDAILSDSGDSMMFKGIRLYKE